MAPVPQQTKRTKLASGMTSLLNFSGSLCHDVVHRDAKLDSLYSDNPSLLQTAAVLSTSTCVVWSESEVMLTGAVYWAVRRAVLPRVFGYELIPRKEVLEDGIGCQCDPGSRIICSR